MNIKDLLTLALKILGIALAVGFCGLVLALGAGLLLSVLMRNQFGGWGDLVGALFGILLFFPAGVILGLIIFKIRHYPGSLLLGTAGVLVGVFVTFGVNSFFHTGLSSSLLIPAFLVLVPVLGAVGYHLRGKKPVTKPG